MRRSSLFGVLDAAALEHIHGHIADLHVQPGQRLFSANDPGLAAFTVREGVVRMERMSERGERRIVRLAGRGDLIGMEALLGQTYATTAVACTPVKLCRLPRALVEELEQQDTHLVRGLMERWQRATAPGSIAGLRANPRCPPPHCAGAAQPAPGRPAPAGLPRRGNPCCWSCRAGSPSSSPAA